MDQSHLLARQRAKNNVPRSAIHRLTKNKHQGKRVVSMLRSAELYQLADKISNCSIVTQTSECEEGHSRVKTTFRCKNRLCPVCFNINAARVRQEMVGAIESLREKYPGLILRYNTFTIPFPQVEKVSKTLTALNSAFRKMLRRKQITKSLLGSFRGIHLICNQAEETVNIHIHAVFAFKATFRSRKGYYISESLWQDLWRESFRDHSITQVKVKKLKTGKKHQSLAQEAGNIAAYAVRAIELENPLHPRVHIFPTTQDKKTQNFLKIFHDALLGRRLYCFTGQLRKARPKKRPAVSSEDVCPECLSPLTTHQHQWDHKTGAYVDRGKIVNEFDGSATDKQVENDQIEIGYELGSSPFPKKRERGQGKTLTLQVPSP